MNAKTNDTPLFYRAGAINALGDGTQRYIDAYHGAKGKNDRLIPRFTDDETGSWRALLVPKDKAVMIATALNTLLGLRDPDLYRDPAEALAAAANDERSEVGNDYHELLAVLFETAYAVGAEFYRLGHKVQEVTPAESLSLNDPAWAIADDFFTSFYPGNYPQMDVRDDAKAIRDYGEHQRQRAKEREKK